MGRAGPSGHGTRRWGAADFFLNEFPFLPLGQGDRTPRARRPRTAGAADGAVVQLLGLDRVIHHAPTPISSAIAACSSWIDTPRRPASVSILRTSEEA